MKSFVAAWLACAALAMLSGCAALPPYAASSPTHAPTNVDATRLARVARAGAPPGLSGVRLMPEGPTAFNARIALARDAEISIDAQYYILQDDPLGLLFLRELSKAARRGVRVRLLVDDLYSAGKDELLALLAEKPNFEVRMFNPLPVHAGPWTARLLFSLHELGRINRRMHNKLFVADNSLAVTGGRNIADEYFMQSGTANFIDMDALVSGPAVRELSDAFDDYWNSAQVRPIGSLVAAPAPRLDELLGKALPSLAERPVDVLGNTPVAEQIDAGQLKQVWVEEIRVLADAPEKIRQDDPEASFADSVTQRTLAVLSSARSEITMVSPYFIPGDEGLKLLQESAARGVRIVALTNSLDATDESLVYAGYARYRRAMLKAGVHLYELGARLSSRERRLGDFRSSSGRLHAKMAVVDRRRLFVGSMNLDGRSARLNTEIGLLIDSPELAAQFYSLTPIRALGAYELRVGKDDTLQWVEHDEDGGERVILDEPGASWPQRFRDWLLLRLVPENTL
jgi:putative cardiolipin synthase